MNSSQILETLKLQPISEEEKQKRHILGRLYGPIATFGEATRNGRLYNKQLWEKALSDDIFLEKVANKSLFLELEHPTDRDTIDMKLACACIPEVPKIIGNDLYAVIDILDTPNGKLLKTFVDYGFVPGISSRGSGDVDMNNEVDPETFFLETWDIVSLPAVKKARLSKLGEALDPKQQKLQKALLEAYNTANDEDKKIMKNTLEELNMPIEESKLKEAPRDPRAIYYDSVDEVPVIDDADIFAEDLEEDAEGEEDLEEHIQDRPDPIEEEAVVQGADNAVVDCPVNPVITHSEDEKPLDCKNEKPALEEPLAGDPVDVRLQEDKKEDKEDKEEDPVEEETPIEDEVEVEAEEEEVPTVKDVLKSLEDLDKDLPVEYAQVTIDDKVYDTTLYFDQLEDKVIIGVDCVPAEEDNEDIEEVSSDDEVKADAEIAEDSADDAGDDEVVESIKDLTRQKDLLESEIKNLRNEKTVSDAKVNELTESLNKYKNAFCRTSELAAKTKDLNDEINSLKEQLTQKETQLESLQTAQKSAQSLTESMQAETTKVKSLTEKLESAQKEFTAEKNKLIEQLNQYKKGYADRTNIAKSYKNKFNAVITRYIESKAQMLGVRPADITSRLDENYDIDAVDKLCNEILSGQVNINRLPLRKNAKVVINESKVSEKTVNTNPDAGYEIDDSLLELAGLKGLKF